MDQKYIYYKLTETNDWEGETWCHYFVDKPGLFEGLEKALVSLGDASDFDSRSISSSTSFPSVYARGTKHGRKRIDGRRSRGSWR